MKTAWCVLVLSLFSVSTCRGQNPALQSGTSAGFSAIYGQRPEAALQLQTWRNSKKLTYSSAVSDMGEGQDKCMSPSDLSSGQFGYLDCWQYTVLQVVSKEDVLLQMGNAKIPPIWLTGFSTNDLVDGQNVRLLGLVEVMGTKTFDTAAGSQKTVRVVRLVEPDDEQIPPVVKPREWTSGDGKYKVEAILMFVANDSAVLEKLDGKRVTVPLKRLSAEDQEFIRKKQWLPGAQR